MSWQFVNLHPKMYFTKYCFIRNTYYIVLYIICISFECVLVIDWLLLHIYLLGIGTDTDIHVCISYVFQYLQSMIMHMPQEYRHLILPDTYYFDVSILPERGLIQNYILTKKILNIILVSLLSILITLLYGVSPVVEVACFNLWSDTIAFLSEYWKSVLSVIF